MTAKVYEECNELDILFRQVSREIAILCDGQIMDGIPADPEIYIA